MARRSLTTDQPAAKGEMENTHIRFDTTDDEGAVAEEVRTKAKLVIQSTLQLRDTLVIVRKLVLQSKLQLRETLWS